MYGRLQERWTGYKIERIKHSFVARHGLVVQAGPFAGMRYVPHAAGSSLLPKLIGSYEAELHGVLAEAVRADHRLIVDIGCAEGYYAVGLALRLPRAQVHAFDIDPRARRLCEELARANDVAGRVSVGGECDIERLRALTAERALIVCDCEGCELHLLRPDLIPGLAGSDLLVELHDLIDPRITPTILSRFAATHDIALLSSTSRDPSAYSTLEGFSDWERRVAVAEFREQQMQWAFMRPKSGSGS